VNKVTRCTRRQGEQGACQQGDKVANHELTVTVSACLNVQERQRADLVCVCVCVRVCVRACVRVRVCVCDSRQDPPVWTETSTFFHAGIIS